MPSLEKMKEIWGGGSGWWGKAWIWYGLRSRRGWGFKLFLGAVFVSIKVKENYKRFMDSACSCRTCSTSSWKGHWSAILAAREPCVMLAGPDSHVLPTTASRSPPQVVAYCERGFPALCPQARALQMSTKSYQAFYFFGTQLFSVAQTLLEQQSWKLRRETETPALFSNFFWLEMFCFSHF